MAHRASFCSALIIVISLSINLPSIAANPFTGKIVYAYENDIYVMNADGSDPTRLTTDPDMDFDPSWSPDGSQIAFRSHRDGDEEVYIINADGSDQTNLTNNPATDYSPDWSPDGAHIAFASDRASSTGNDIWVINSVGTDPVQITDVDGINEYPSWSPDGSQIAFHCTFGRIMENGTGDFEICVVNADGSDLRQLTDTEGENTQPAWSPDGSQIAFQSNRHGWPSLPDYVPPAYDGHTFGEFDLFIMNVDGSDQANLTNNPRQDDTFPA